MNSEGASRRKAKPLVASFIITTFALLGVGCHKKEPLEIQRPPAPVTIASAVTQDVPVYLDAIGKTVAREVVSIEPRAVPGEGAQPDIVVPLWSAGKAI